MKMKLQTCSSDSCRHLVASLKAKKINKSNNLVEPTTHGHRTAMTSIQASSEKQLNPRRQTLTKTNNNGTEIYDICSTIKLHFQKFKTIKLEKLL